MNDPKQSHNAFDDLLEGDEPNASPKPGIIADGARADLATVRDDAKRAAAHVRERGQQAARQAHERAHAIGASVRRELPGRVANVRAAVAGQMKAIRWRAVAKPLLIGSAVILAALAGALYLNAKRIHDLEAQDAQGAPAATATASAPTNTTNAHGLVATQYSAASPVAATVATVPSVSPAAPAAVPVTPIAPVAQTAVPVASSLPPVPSEANAGTCALALPTLNTLYALTRARSPMEETWIRFGYDCLGARRVDCRRLRICVAGYSGCIEAVRCGAHRKPRRAPAGDRHRRAAPSAGIDHTTREETGTGCRATCGGRSAACRSGLTHLHSADATGHLHPARRCHDDGRRTDGRRAGITGRHRGCSVRNHFPHGLRRSLHCGRRSVVGSGARHAACARLPG